VTKWGTLASPPATPVSKWFERIALDVDAEQWEIVADPRGRMVALEPLPNPQQEAVGAPVAETRTVPADAPS
jgi:hypothetical protein